MTLALAAVGLTVGCEEAAEQPAAQALRAPGKAPTQTGSRTGGSKSKTPIKAAPGGKSSAKSTKINAATKRLVQQKVQAQWSKLSSTDKHKLGKSMWGLHAAMKDSPVPHVTLHPPADPPPKKPCKDCGDKKGYPSDPCQGKRDDLEDLMQDAILKGLVVNTLQAMKQGLVDMQFYGGVADLVANIATTTLTLVTAGGGAALGRAAAKALAGIALDQVQSAIVDAIAGALPPPLDAAVQGELSIALLDKLIGAAEDALKAANDKKTKAIIDLNKCQADYSASLKQIDKDNKTVESCRTANPAYCL